MIYALVFSVTSANILERMRVLGSNFQPLEASTLSLTWEDCGGLSKVTSMQPDQLVMGSTTTVTGKGTMPSQVSGGTYDIKMSAGFINENWSGDICSAKTFNLPLDMGSVKFNGMSCPVPKGESSLSMDIKMSSLIPPSMASATIKVTAKDTNGQELLCVNMKTKPKAAELAAATDVCKNTPADMAIWNKDGKTGFAADLSKCGHQCLGGADCTTKCIAKDYGYTEACATCFGTLTGCTKDNCMFDCMLNPNGQSCKSCVDQHCTPAFESCSGLTPPSSNVE